MCFNRTKTDNITQYPMGAHGNLIFFRLITQWLVLAQLLSLNLIVISPFPYVHARVQKTK